MTVHTTSTPTLPSAPRRFGRNAILATVGGGVVLAATVTAAVYMARSDTSEPISPPVAAAAVQPAATAIEVASSPAAPYTVYIAGSAEQASMIEAGLNDSASIRMTPRCTQ